MSDGTPECVSDRMSECMSDRQMKCQIECQITCQNICQLVGITRSNVIMNTDFIQCAILGQKKVFIIKALRDILNIQKSWVCEFQQCLAACGGSNSKYDMINTPFRVISSTHQSTGWGPPVM